MAVGIQAGEIFRPRWSHVLYSLFLPVIKETAGIRQYVREHGQLGMPSQILEAWPKLVTFM